jgi:hypothetical protein
MRPGWKTLGPSAASAAVLLAFLALSAGPTPAAGDEPVRLGFGRLFRFGGGSSPSSPSSDQPPDYPASGMVEGPSAGPPPPPGVAAVAGPAPRIVARPRVSRPVTESDPLICRVTLNRSDDGGTFGMFLQVYADGTILDGEGAHRVSRDDLRPLVEALQSGDLYRLKGHCGGPSTDYVESVHVTVFERSLGRLRASTFSYSGNPQGCDNAVRHLHATLDNLQSRVARPPAAPASASSPAPAANVVVGGASGLAPLPDPVAPLAEPAPRPGAAVIPLTTDH